MKSVTTSTVFVVFLLALSMFLATAQAQKVAFMTSVQGPGDLSTWTDAGTATGIDAGDAVCQARALAAGLANPQDFVAWLSDSSDDAYCRIHGLNGAVALNCGQGTLPADAGPWVRVDGFPFADVITEMLSPNGKIYTPVLLDEFGQQGGEYYYWTSTSDTGALSTVNPSACTNWSSLSASDDAYAGRATRTTRYWTHSDGNFCHHPLRLLCMEGGGDGAALPDFSSDERVAFLTSVDGIGNLSTWPDALAVGATGIDAGDAVCRARATAAGLDDPTSFKAWLSDSTTNAKDRFINDGRWVRLDGVKIADNLADLTDGELFTSINVMETGEYYDSWETVWTGTDQDGTLISGACDDWAPGSDATQGRVGRPVDVTPLWTTNFDRDCDTPQRLYCFSDAVSTWIFGDDFESGDMGSWSATQGGL